MQVNDLGKPTSGGEWIKRIFEGSLLLWGLYAAFLTISLLAVTSGLSSEVYEYYGEGGIHPVLKHILFVIAGVMLTLIISQLPPVWFRNKTVIYSIVVIGMVIALFFWGAKVNGAVRWIDVKGIRLQPSEFFKLCLILWGAIAYANSQGQPERVATRYYVTYWIFSVVLTALLSIYNLSAGVLFISFVGIYSFVLRAPRRLLIKGLLGLLAGGALFVTTLVAVPGDVLERVLPRAVTWQNRLNNLGSSAEKEEDKYILNDNDRQSKLGKIALANSRLLLHGPGRSKVRDSLPMAYSDFVYAIIVEEYGLLGLLLIPFLYGVWFFQAGMLARREKNRYRQALLLGIGLMFPLQALINISVVSGLFMTGQTLPLISYGGSSLMVSSIAMGIMISISRVQSEVATLELEAQRLRSDEAEE